MGVTATNKHAIFFDKTEARCGFPSAGKNACVASIAELLENVRGSEKEEWLELDGYEV